MAYYRTRKVIEAAQWNNDDKSYSELFEFLKKHSKEVIMARIGLNSNKLKVIVVDKSNIRRTYTLDQGDFMVKDKILYEMTGKGFNREYRWDEEYNNDISKKDISKKDKHKINN